MFEITLHTSVPSARDPQFRAIGDLDIFDASAVRKALRLHAIDGVGAVRLNLSGVTWVNASALGHLARTRSQMAEVLGIRLDLVEWSASVQRMSERTGLCQVLGRVA